MSSSKLLYEAGNDGWNAGRGEIITLCGGLGMEKSSSYDVASPTGGRISGMGLRGTFGVSTQDMFCC